MISAVNEFLDDLRGGRMTESPVVKVEQGLLQGRVVNSPNGKAYYSFQGIPYAKPPIGSLRFRDPQPPEAWEGIREATAEGNEAAQIDELLNRPYTGDENCLFLNVYTPSIDGEFLPVMVFLHGGGFRFGSGNSNLYGGDNLVEKDVIVVTINYRLGPLGFLCLNTPEVPGNAGMKDMVQALKWVHQNIGSFGGNSRNITIFGESVGGASVCYLTGSPSSKNLISKAIIESGTALNAWAFQKQPIENARNLALELGCESSQIDDILEFLTTTPVRDIIEAAIKLSSIENMFETGVNMFSPVVEMEFPGVESFITEPFINIITSGRTADIPIMIGSTTLEFSRHKKANDLQTYIPSNLQIENNSEESLAFVENLKQLYFKGEPSSEENTINKFQLFSDTFINVDTHRYIQYLIKSTNKPIYYYKFNYIGELNISKKLFKDVSVEYAGHMDELGYLFSNEYQKSVEPTAEDVKMRERMVRLWTNFAKTGNPTPEVNHYLTVTWLPVTKDELYYLNLSNELTLRSNPDQEKMAFWEDLYNKYYKAWEHDADNERFEISSTPIIVQETIITTSTIVNGEEVTQTQVVVDVQDSSGERVQIQETFENNEPVHVDNVTENLQEIANNKFELDGHDVDVVEEDLGVQNNSVESAQTQKIIENNETPAHVENVIDSLKEITNNKLVIDDYKSNVVEQVDFGVNIGKLQEKFMNSQNGMENGNVDKKPRPSNEIKMVQGNNVHPKDVIRANDPPEDDLPKNIGVNKFVNFFESLGGKK